MNREQKLRKRIRALTIVMIAGLVLSGVTAIPVVAELDLLARWLGVANTADPESLTGVHRWIWLVRDGLHATDGQYPFLLYGYDWLAFGHFVIALAFVGALRDPVRNIWIFEFGMIACVLVIPFALVAGGFREIPLGWRLIDCSFGLLGFIPLWFARRDALELKTEQISQPAPQAT